MAVTGDSIKFKRGETLTITQQIVTAESYYANPTVPALWVPVDITLYTAVIAIKLSISTPDTSMLYEHANLPGSHLDPVNGKTLFTLLPADTLKFPVSANNQHYTFECWLLDQYGNPYASPQGDVFVMSGVIQDITQVPGVTVA